MRFLLGQSYLFLARGCVDRVHALRQVAWIFHSRVGRVDPVGHGVAVAPFTAVDRHASAGGVGLAYNRGWLRGCYCGSCSCGNPGGGHGGNRGRGHRGCRRGHRRCRPTWVGGGHRGRLRQRGKRRDHTGAALGGRALLRSTESEPMISKICRRFMPKQVYPQTWDLACLQLLWFGCSSDTDYYLCWKWWWTSSPLRWVDIRSARAFGGRELWLYGSSAG